MNYIGSKLSLLPFLEQSITSVVGDQELGDLTFCDLFAGTGAVGRHFKQKGCKVVANDIQYYSYVLNKQYIDNHEWMPFQGLEPEVEGLKDLPLDVTRQTLVCAYLDSIEGEKGFIYHNYSQGDSLDEQESRLYFSRDNAMKCDAIRSKLAYWHLAGKISDNEYYFLLATLLEAIDRVANTASVYGAYLKALKRSAQRPLKMIPAETIINEQTHEVYNLDANTLAKDIRTDILYLDPPYNQRQYSANYHLLETIACYDAPLIKGKTGMRDYSKQKSLYCSKRDVAKAFEDLILSVDARYIFLSYNNEGLLTFEQIRGIMSQRGEYGCFERRYNRFKADNASSHRQIKADHTTEYVHYVIVR